MKQKAKKEKTKLADLIAAAKEAGATVTVGLQAKLPDHFPSDPQAVRLLLEESERMSKMGNAWMGAKEPNAVAGEFCLRNGWAFQLAAAWLRCKLKGEFEKNSSSFPA